jgi:hypothetical protein
MSDGFRTFLGPLNAFLNAFFYALSAFLNAFFRLSQNASLSGSRYWKQYKDKAASKGKQDPMRDCLNDHRWLLTGYTKKISQKSCTAGRVPPVSHCC